MSWSSIDLPRPNAGSCSRNLGDDFSWRFGRVSRPRRLLDRRSPAGFRVGDPVGKWQGQETLPQLGLDCENSGKLFPARLGLTMTSLS